MQRQPYARAAKNTFEYEELGCIKQGQPYVRAAKNTFEYEEQGCIRQGKSYTRAAKNTFENEEQGCIRQGHPYARAAKRHFRILKSATYHSLFAVNHTTFIRVSRISALTLHIIYIIVNNKTCH